MAKRRGKAGSTLGDIAENLGTLLGTTERKASELLRHLSSEHPLRWPKAAGTPGKKSKPRARKAAASRKATPKGEHSGSASRSKGARKTTRKPSAR